MLKVGSVGFEWGADTKQLEQANDRIIKKNKEVDKSVQDTQSGYEKYQKGAELALAGVGIAITALISVGVGLTNQAREYNNTWRAELAKARGDIGLQEEALQRLEKTARSTFLKGYGESITDAIDSVTALYANLENLDSVSEESLQDLSEKLVKLSGTTGKSYAELASAAGTLQRQFGVDQNKSLDLINEGFQSNLNRSDDFLDSIKEYSVHFKTSGASASFMFNLMKSGLSDGVLGTDKILDTYKEWNDLVTDLSDEQIQMYHDLGFNNDNFFQKLRDGTLPGSEAFVQVIAEISKIQDPLEKGRVGVGLLGTMFRDLGADTSLLTDFVSSNTEEWGGNKEALDNLNGSVDENQLKIESLKRTNEDLRAQALEPVANKVTELEIQFWSFINPIIASEENLTILLWVIVAVIAVFTFLAIVILISLIPAFIAGAVAGFLMIAPFLLVIAIVIIVIAVFVLLYMSIQNNVLGIRDALENGGRFIWNLTKSIGNYFIDMANSGIDAINSLIWAVNQLSGFTGFSFDYVSTIPRLRTGTDNFPGGFAMINDGGAKESVEGDLVYMSKGSKVLNSARTDSNERSISQSGQQVVHQTTVLHLQELSDPYIVSFFKANQKNLAKAGIITQ